MSAIHKKNAADRLSWFPYLEAALDKHTMLAVLDVTGNIIHVNDKLCEISQFDKDELIGSSYRMMASGNHPKSFFKSISDVIHSGEAWHGEVKNRRKTGEYYWINCTVLPFMDDSQKILGFIVIETDITRSKNSEASLRSSLNLLKSTFENFPGGISYFSKDLNLESANKLFYQILDLPEDQLPQGCQYEDIIRYNAARGDYGDGDVEALVGERVELAKKFEKHAFERRRPDGQCLEIRGFPLPEGGFVTTYVDVTERKRAEATNTRLAKIVEAAFNEVYVIDAKTLKFLQVNHSACKNLGYTVEEMLELTPVDLKPDFTLEKFEEIIAPLRSGEKDHLRFETLHQRKDQSQYIAQITLQLISSDDFPVFAAIIEDITEKRHHELQIVHMAHHDALTDLPNRTLLQMRLEEALMQRANGSHFAVLCLDLDRFKTINDTFGHAVGDRILKITAQRLQSCVGAGDTVARLGGDEFAVIQNLSEDSRDAALMADRISKLIRKPFNIDGKNICVDTSIGIAVAQADMANPDQLLHHADLAMYRAKDDGRGTYHYFEPELDALMQERRKLEIDLIKGLENDEFEVMYQPIVNLESNDIISFEALLRWHHPERGNISPAEFIPIAEESGFIRMLGKWVLQKACSDAANWPSAVKIAVNLSPALFHNQNLALHITSILAENNFPASRLELEITESVLMQETEQVLLTLHQLRKLGVQISMDDFGTGYSSLSYLRSFPFDKIKIDRSFVRDLSSKSDSIAFIQVITALGNKLGISILAEGVETFEQKSIIHAEGCSEMQGYFFSPPRSYDEVVKLFFPDGKQQKSIA